MRARAQARKTPTVNAAVKTSLPLPLPRLLARLRGSPPVATCHQPPSSFSDFRPTPLLWQSENPPRPNESRVGAHTHLRLVIGRERVASRVQSRGRAQNGRPLGCRVILFRERQPRLCAPETNADVRERNIAERDYNYSHRAKKLYGKSACARAVINERDGNFHSNYTHKALNDGLSITREFVSISPATPSLRKG